MRAVILLLWRLGVVHIRDILLLLGVWSRIIGSYSLICAIAPSTPAQTFASIARWLPLSLPLRFNAIRTFPASAAVDIAVDVRSPPPCDGNEKSNSNKVISEQSKESRSRRSSHSSRRSYYSRQSTLASISETCPFGEGGDRCESSSSHSPSPSQSSSPSPSPSQPSPSPSQPSPSQCEGEGEGELEDV